MKLINIMTPFGLMAVPYYELSTNETYADYIRNGYVGYRYPPEELVYIPTLSFQVRNETQEIKKAIKKLINVISNPKTIKRELVKEYGELTSLQNQAIKGISDNHAVIRWALQDLLELKKVYTHMIPAKVSQELKNSTVLDADVTQEIGLILRWYLETFLY